MSLKGLPSKLDLQNMKFKNLNLKFWTIKTKEISNTVFMKSLLNVQENIFENIKVVNSFLKLHNRSK